MKSKKKYKYGSYIPQEQLQQINPLPQFPDGGRIDMWQQANYYNTIADTGNNFQIPEWAEPQMVGNSYLPHNVGSSTYMASPQSPIEGEMQLSPTATNNTKSPKGGNAMGIVTGAFQGFREVGKIMSDVVSVGIPALNALLPDQKPRTNNYQPLAYNPRPMGSIPTYEDGGYITKTRKAGKKGRITVTEEVPEYAPNPYIPTEPIPTREFQQVNVPPTTQAKELSFEKLHNSLGNEFYSPVFSGYSYGDALNTLHQLPQQYQGLPVQNSPDLFANMWQGFYPNTQSNQWQPTELPIYDNGGNISPEKAKKILKDGKIRGKKITEKQRKYFGAMSNMENGGYMEGQELELTPAQIKKLEAQGYKLQY